MVTTTTEPMGLISNFVLNVLTFVGWQSRWFILEDGILSYYKSYEEVSQGCKGSMNVSVCEIVVNHADNTRLDLVISGGEQVL